MMQMETNFILTQDENTKNEFVKAGLTLVQEVGGAYLFLNEKTRLKFAKGRNDLKYTFTNKMVF